jgi:membrane protease YdiL (CAAX protease family)
MEMENVVLASGAARNVSVDQASPRFTWYTVGLVVLIYAIAVLEQRVSRHIPHHRVPFRFEARVFIVEWALFFVAYRGIRDSGVRFADAMGRRPWSSLPELRKDITAALIVVLLIYINGHLLRYLGPFQTSSVGHATTGYQYVFTLFVAVSAGVTEEVIFRGLLLPQFHLLIGNIAAATVMQSCVFAVAHGGNQSPTQFLKHCCSGCLFAYLAITRKSLWPAILAHVLFDVLVYSIQFWGR